MDAKKGEAATAEAVCSDALAVAVRLVGEVRLGRDE